jgi:hypothetical protein
VAYRDRRTISFLLSSVAFVVFTSCQDASAPQSPPTPKPAPETRSAPAPDVSPAAAWFGYIDATASRLLMLQGDEQPTAVQAQVITTAVCSEGRQTLLRYVRFQNGTSNSTGRQNAGNLENDEGHLFAVAGPARPGDTCLLLPSGYLSRYPLVSNEYPQAERRQLRDAYQKADTLVHLAPFQAPGDFARTTVERIEREKTRKVRLYWLLHRAGASQQIAIVEFDPEGNNMLASLVLADSERLSFFDMPAEQKDGGSCWRVDDGCRLHPEEMEVPAVLGAAGETLVFYTSRGPEGQNIRLLQSTGGALVEIKRAYRYQAPR